MAQRKRKKTKKESNLGSVFMTIILTCILIVLGRVASEEQIENKDIPAVAYADKLNAADDAEVEDNDNNKTKVLDVNQLDTDTYPESLIELCKKNPETTEFVLDYPNHADDENNYDEIDISGEVKEGEIPLFIQWDSRWGYKKYGSDYMALTGCGPTCLSMVYTGLTGETNMNPYEMAKKAQAEGFYVENVGTSWSIMTKMATELGLVSRQVTFKKERILQLLQEGTPIICIMGPGDFTDNGHFIVLTGVDSDGNIIVNDPNSKINSSKSWSVESIMSQTKNLWSFQI